MSLRTVLNTTKEKEVGLLTRWKNNCGMSNETIGIDGVDNQIKPGSRGEGEVQVVMN